MNEAGLRDPKAITFEELGSGYHLFITFGQTHAHSVNGVTFNKDLVAVIRCSDYAEGRKIAHELFDGVFATSYGQEQIEKSMCHFPRGMAYAN